MNELGISSVVPQTYNSEGISKLIAKKDYRKCIVFCGDKAPQLLSITNADIDVFPCYESQDKKNIDFGKIKELDESIILIYTNQSLEILVKNVKACEMEKIILICASERIRKLASNYSFKDCVLAKSPLDKDILNAASKMSN